MNEIFQAKEAIDRFLEERPNHKSADWLGSWSQSMEEATSEEGVFERNETLRVIGPFGHIDLRGVKGAKIALTYKNAIHSQFREQHLPRDLEKSIMKAASTKKVPI